MAVTVPLIGRPRRPTRRAKRRARTGMLLVAPAALLLLIFFAIPLIQVVWMSFFDWPLLGKPAWNGGENYIQMFDEPGFVYSLGFSGVYTLIMVPLLLIIGLGLASLLKNKRPGVGFFRTLFFAPVVVGGAATAYLFIYLVNPRVGLFNRMLQDLGLMGDSLVWLGDPGLALGVVIVMTVWKSAGFGMLLLLTGMQSIPAELTEAARIDRATPWQTFRHITLPLLRRQLALVIVLNAISSILVFEQFKLLTGGGPNGKTTPIVMEILNVSFSRYELGMGAAMSILLMVVVGAISAIQLFLLRDKDVVR